MVMKYYILFIVILLVAVNPVILGQNDSLKAEEAETFYPVGHLNRAQLQHDSVYAKFFIEEYTQYNPDLSILNDLQPEIYLTMVTIVLGTWCRDSKEQVPRFYKILDNINYDSGTIELIGVDKQKEAGDMDLSKLNIERVPTFIFYRNGDEIGRIIETPKQSLEQDLLEILEINK
jgi:hypothetical protein